MKTDTKPSLSEILSNFGVTIRFYPAIARTDPEGWEHFTFETSLSRNGKVFWGGPYRMGLGHVKFPPKDSEHKLWMYGLQNYNINLMYTLWSKPGSKMLPEYQGEKMEIYRQLAVKQKLAPKLEDVMHSLLSEGSAQWDNETFDSWAENVGYSPDSIKALKTFDACVEIGRAISRAFKPSEIEEMREAAQEM